MIPKFTSPKTWQQAELLMQPTFIRIIDNIRKQLDASEWEGTYQNIQVWPDGVTPEEKVRIVQLQKELETASPEESLTIQAALDHLPTPIPGYELHLSRHDLHLTIDLWQLCYQICFANYDELQVSQAPIQVDEQLLNENNEVDWHQLDEKAQACIREIFTRLPE
ncbi:MAG: hypothetical protein VKJ64_16565 [Leptolyngbyaceae bacterium]|nr:hypothetical protein [Leptolyngbyaceae bacterium]